MVEASQAILFCVCDAVVVYRCTIQSVIRIFLDSISVAIFGFVIDFKYLKCLGLML